VLLAAIGGALGVLVAVWTVDVLIGLAPASLARFDEVAVDVRLLLAGIGITALTGIAFGLWPAWRASGTPAGTAINAAARASAGRERRRTQQLLVFGELALALVQLLAGQRPRSPGASCLLRERAGYVGRSPTGRQSEVAIRHPGSEKLDDGSPADQFRQGDARGSFGEGGSRTPALNDEPMASDERPTTNDQ